MLNRIIEQKKKEVEQIKRSLKSQDPVSVMGDRRGFVFAINENAQKNESSIIAEIKNHTPYRTTEYKKIENRPMAYQDGGASAISAVTDKLFFKGNLDGIGYIKANSVLPVLCKDFIIDKAQLFPIAEARADAVLLISELILNLYEGDPPYEQLMKLVNEVGRHHMDLVLEFSTDAGFNLVYDFYNESGYYHRDWIQLMFNTRDLSAPEKTGSLTRILNNARYNRKFKYHIGYNVLKQDLILASNISSPRELKIYFDELDIRKFLVGSYLMETNDPEARLKALACKG